MEQGKGEYIFDFNSQIVYAILPSYLANLSVLCANPGILISYLNAN